MTRLDEPLLDVLGDKTAKVLDKSLGITTVGDLLQHYPRRYAQRGELTDMRTLQDGEHVTVVAEILRVTNRRMRNRRGNLLEVVVTDGTGNLTLTFFNQAWRLKDLVQGRRCLFAGKVSTYRGQRQLSHPDYEFIGPPHDDMGRPQEFIRELIPVYPATKDITSWKIAKSVRMVLDTLGIDDDPLPEELRERHSLLGLREAYEKIHLPLDLSDVATAKERLKWDEAFVLQVALAQRRWTAGALPADPRPVRDGGMLTAFDARLPFELTSGQRAVGEEISRDLACAHPMHRLLQGDVGAGKTVVALRAMLQVVDDGGQAVLLAPTEVLAQQHYRSITGMLGPLASAGELGGAEVATRVVLLTGSQGVRARRTALLDTVTGEAGIAVGTHALLEERVQFTDLGLIVIDEQHRFGVEQRDALRAKANGGRPHVLVMTATPIPRTVAMTVYGDLDTSALTELPAGRSPIKTHVVPSAERPRYLERTWERIKEEVSGGRQAYVVCPRIGGDAEPGKPEDLEPREDESPDQRPPVAVLDLAPELERDSLHGLRIGVLHGRLPSDEKDSVMRRFSRGELDVLVATTVIEVGVDVPNATVMVVMDAERFGVSQLHQIRGRVGRGSEPGLCLLVTEAPAESPARERLDAVASTLDGFELSRIDLQQRREGDVLGESQSGARSSLKLLTLLKDEKLIRTARDEATTLVARDPKLASHPLLAAELRALLNEEQAEFLDKT